MKSLIVTLLLTCSALNLGAETSKEYALRGQRAWSAFECSSLASVAGKKELQAKLFTYGFEEGKAFLDALKKDKIKKEDLDSGVPMIMLLLLQGPSDDFILGRVFENAQEHALKEVYKTEPGRIQSDEERTLLARNELDRRNCALIASKQQ